MVTNRTGQEAMQRQHAHGTSRRSLLAVVVAGMGALASLPAWAHRGNAASDRESRKLANLKTMGAEHQVHAIRYVSGWYHVMTATGHRSEFAERNLLVKVDSSALGPHAGKPVIVPAGHIGDRALVFFAAPGEISTFIR